MSMMSHFAFEVKPIIVRQQNTKRNNLADQYLAHCIKVAAAF